MSRSRPFRRTSAAAAPAVAASLIAASIGAIAFVALLLPAPGAAVPHGLSASDVRDGYARSVAEQWDAASVRFPDVPQPAIDGVIVLAPDERDRALELCFARRGIIATIDGEESTFALPAGMADADFAVTEFVCRATYPTASSYDLILSAEQRDALYDYYVGVLSPCLVTQGVRVTAPPSRDAFVQYSGSGVLWIPAPVTDASPCAGEPAWLTPAAAS